MSSKSSTSLLLATLAGIILGGLFGYYLPDVMLSLSFVGQLFVNALRIVAIPVIIAGIVVGVAALANIGRVNRAVGRTLLYFIATGAIAVVIGFVLVELIQPGAGISTADAVMPVEINRVTSVSIQQLLSSILPENLMAATGQGQFLGLIIFSLFFGGALIVLGQKGTAVVDFFRVVNDVALRLVHLLMYVAPIGLLSLVATAVAQNVHSARPILSSVGMFSLTIIAGFVVHGLIVLPLALKILGNRPFWGYLSGTAPALATAFGTASPAATLPVTYDCVTEKCKVDNRAGALTLPLGAMINMNGTGMYLVIAAFFCAQAFGIELSLIQIAVAVLVAFLLSLGATLVPGMSLMVLAVVLFSANFPAEAYAGIGLVLVVDWFFDRLRSVLNVWSDTVGAAVIGEIFEFKTARRVRPAMEERRPSKRTGGARRYDGKRVAKGKTRSDRGQQRSEREATSRKGDRSSRKKEGDGRGRKQERRPRQDLRRGPEPGRKEDKGKKSDFVLPPVPYHVLDSELKPKREPEADDKRRSRDRESERNGLSPETIERERAKVSAQLRELRRNEESVDSDAEATPTRVREDASRDSSGADGEERSAATFPRVDFSSDDDLAVTAAPATVSGDHLQDDLTGLSHESLPEREDSGNGTSSGGEEKEASEQPDANAAFGRSKSRRGPVPKSSREGDEEPQQKPEPSPEYSTENISFGRGKRKKPSS
ncbi:MAG: cation:dicarboxylase symporter family transporter [Candidatus Zixiibacteriota bacterium]|nr:MAG: cation:dicarboxylase symporter family transporter [candidate division Zixibacteria bacterium]